MEDLDFSDLLDSIELTFTRYNTFLQENGYGLKYDIGNAQMFVIEGMDKVRSVIEKNRKRKRRLWLRQRANCKNGIERG